MPADILVVTPLTEVGETVRRVLEETTLYRVHIVNNKASAIVRANEMGIPLAMLDLALGREWVEEIGAALRTTQKGINLILLNDQTLTPPAFETLRPWILVRKPFTMAEFMTAISQPQSAAPPETSDDKTHPWLGDKNKAAQRLTRLTLSSSAQAALITRKNDLWAYAGGLSQEAAKELAQAVSRNWNSQKGADLLRFIRLESTKAEHMLYATNLTEDSVLAFVFESEMPFSAIRSQAVKLVEDLDAMELQKQAIEAGEPAEDESRQEENIPPISNILTDIPAPNPLKSEPSAPRKKAEKIADFDPNQTRVSEPLADAAVFSRESSPAMRLTPTLPPREVQPANKKRAAVEVEERPATPVAPSSLEATRPTAAARPATPVAAPVSGAETRESPTTEAAKKLVIESASAGMYHLSYACLLVPRFSTHYITGDLSNRLETEWLPNICVAFGWRLEYLAVRPEYLQWVVNVQPNTSPGHLMRIIRQQSSDKIFAEFPRFKRENASNDFWAPGYLIMGGSQPHPAQLVRDYINQTRRRQGLHENEQRT
ncbi:MAG: hypothetical protein Fur002_14810 [Anaerolineales bacterium]